MKLPAILNKLLPGGAPKTPISAAPNFDALSPAEKQKVAQRLQRVMQLGYTALKPGRRATLSIERKSEDEILRIADRNKLTSASREAMRNTPLARIINNQLQVNVVGATGGTLQFTTPSEEWNAEAGNLFAGWKRAAEFVDGLHFNDCLTLLLTSLNTGGDVVALFDHGPLGDTGRILFFESDQIANVREDFFKTRYGQFGYTQKNGRVYDANGRAVGVIVSVSQRGKTVFDPDSCFILINDDPDRDPRYPHFIHARNLWRFNQGRGISPETASIGTVLDISETVENEILASKLNAKMVGQILDSNPLAEQPKVPSKFLPPPPGEPCATPGMEDSALTDAVAALATQQPEEWKADHLRAVGIEFDEMPPNVRMELFDTKRPNPNLPQVMNWLAGFCSGIYGMGRQYVTLQPENSYTAFRGAQCLARPSFELMQKRLERMFCDWAAVQVIFRAIRLGRISAPPAGWENALFWRWPSQPEVNEKEAAAATRAHLANGTLTFRELLGPKYKTVLREVGDDAAFLKSVGLIHPAAESVSGAVQQPEPPSAPAQELNT